jgi:hypothetical protein
MGRLCELLAELEGAAGTSNITELRHETHASLANHSCVVRHNGQSVRLKNTGVEWKVVRSARMPVEMARRVSGQRIITIPIEGLLLLRWRPSCTVLVRQKNKEPVTIPRHCQGARKIAATGMKEASN